MKLRRMKHCHLVSIILSHLWQWYWPRLLCYHAFCFDCYVCTGSHSNVLQIPSHVAYHIHYNVLLPAVCSGCSSQSPPPDGKIHFLTRIRILQLLLPVVCGLWSQLFTAALTRRGVHDLCVVHQSTPSSPCLLPRL